MPRRARNKGQKPANARLCPIVSLALGGETDKYSVCAATCEIASSCHAERHGGATPAESAESFALPRNGRSSISEQPVGANISGGGSDDCGADCERDRTAAEGQPGQARRWERRNAADRSALISEHFPKAPRKIRFSGDDR